MDWPRPFPSYVGFELQFRKSKMYGSDWWVFKQELLGEHFSEEDGTIRLKTTVCEVPETADQSLRDLKDRFCVHTMKIAADPKHSASIFRLSRLREEESGFVGFALPRPRGESGRPGGPPQLDVWFDFQCALGAGGDSVRILNSEYLARHGRSAADRGAAVGFLFRASRRSELAPDLVPGDAERIQFGGLPAALRGWDPMAPSEPQPQAFKAILDLQSLGPIDTVKQQFQARLSVELRWTVTRADVYQWVINERDWQTSWQPPPLEAVNMVPDASNVVQYGRPELDRTSGAELWAFQTVRIRGTFHEGLELQNFPFDVQPLTISLNFGKLPKFTPELQSKVNMKPMLEASSAWFLLCDVAMKDNTPLIAEDQEYAVEMKATVARNSRPVLLRVMLVMFVVQVLSLCAFVLHPTSDVANRLSLTFTLILTAAAYTVVIQGYLPELGYLTFLDTYVAFTFIFISLISVFMTLIARFAPATHVAVANFWGFIAFMSFAVLWNLATLGYIGARIRSRRRRRAKGGGAGAAAAAAVSRWRAVAGRSKCWPWPG